MRIFIITNYPEIQSIKDMAATCHEIGHDFSLISTDHLLIGDPTFNEDDIIINRHSGIDYQDDDIDFLSQLKEEKKCHIINDPSLTRIFRDKYKQYSFYQKKSLVTVPTISLELATKEELLQFLNVNSQQYFLTKPLRSNQAKGITIYERNDLDLEKLLAQGDRRYVLQPYLQKSCEWRVLILNNKIHSVVKKESQKEISLLNCESSELRCIKEDEIPPALHSLIQQCIKVINLHIMALDILELPNKEYVLLEVNNVPGFKHVNKTCQINIAKDFILSLTH
jgi:glutathione synthase/RimK-type ligase-like ATP-grasp enzyme